MSFKAPDITAPRFKIRSKPVIDKDFLDKFRKRFPENRNIKHTTFSRIMIAVHEEIVQGIIENRDGIELPEGLGFLFIANCQKSKKQNIDFKASKLAGEKVLHQNWESDNRLMKIMFSNGAAKYKLPNKQVWAFRLSKANRKTVSAAYKKQWAKYHIIPNMKGIQSMFKRGLRKTRFKDRVTEIPMDYNEFKMD